MSAHVLSSAAFDSIEPELRARIPAEYNVEFDDPLLRESFSRYIVLREWADLVARAAPDLSPGEHFYNLYYWALRFSKLYTRMRGRDAGVEQQVFDILSAPNCDPDWAIVEFISNRVRQELEE